MQSGYGALNKLNELLGITPQPAGSVQYAGSPTATGAGQQPQPADFGSLTKPFTADDWQQLSPMYNFQLQQGQQGVLNQDSGALGAESGAALKDLISFNQGTANSSFNNAFSLYQQQQGNIYNRLAGVAQLGQTSAANTGQQGTALAGNMGSAAVAAGNAMGAGISSAANSIGNSLNSYAAYQSLGQPSGGVDYGTPVSNFDNGGTMSAGDGYTFNAPG